MKYLDKKVYIDECAPLGAKDLTDEYWETLLQGERDGKEIYWDAEYPKLRIKVPTEAQNISRRTAYLDAYRKYQAAVNYGEFERVAAVDAFIAKLRNKDWTAYEDIPPQIQYFSGEIGFADSGLVEGA